MVTTIVVVIIGILVVRSRSENRPTVVIPTVKIILRIIIILFIIIITGIVVSLFQMRTPIFGEWPPHNRMNSTTIVVVVVFGWQSSFVWLVFSFDFVVVGGTVGRRHNCG